ncbi:PREDICTED: uncharacterized protein LOC105138476 [Populus euphratica]|uniref:Uncharacterized protein LOC105138476 n=1 Tax=Populus euphratica TaxID=75702 RepID=A0AAJ6V857_POPEU|nr:PREDICTED: uncharacterized protein LOC105138476 [Populus euphratica]
MELELGLKITRTRDDINSFTDLRIAKDHAGPLFSSRETETMFTLIGYLKGFRKENIDIKINEDGDRISISGKKPVQEMVLIGWIMHKKEVELRSFRKAFRIPDGVVLDKIKARFNDEESTLTIILPKLVKGIRDVELEEVKGEEVDKGKGEATQAVADKASEVESREPELKTVEQSGQALQNKNVVEQKADAAEIVPERVVDTTLIKKLEPTDQSELEEATPEKAEPPSTTTSATYQETVIQKPKLVLPEKEIEHQESKEAAPAEETRSEELPGLKEQGKKQQNPEAKSTREETLEEHPYGPERNQLTEAVMDQETNPPEVSNQPSAQADHGHTEEANHLDKTEISHESEKLETETNVQEPTMLEPDEEKKLAETPHPADKSRNNEAQGSKESHGIGNDIKEAATNRNDPVSRRTKLCPPLVFAGSAILVSIVVLVIDWIRAKKR